MYLARNIMTTVASAATIVMFEERKEKNTSLSQTLYQKDGDEAGPAPKWLAIGLSMATTSQLISPKTRIQHRIKNINYQIDDDEK